MLGALDGVVDSQLLRGWFGGEQDGWFVLRNDAQEDSEQTLTIKAGPPGANGRHTSVNVTMNSSQPKAAIGIVVRNSAHKGTCVAELTAEADANLFCVIDGEFESIGSLANAAKLDGTDIIEMVETPGTARFIVNGKPLGDVTNGAALSDEIGIMAYERGTFGVADFIVTDVPGSDTSAQTQGSGLPPRGGSGASAPAEESTTGGGSDIAARMAAIMGPLANAILDADPQDG
ncbi:MAG: hypothetical protein EON57_11610, partial [Alphaproteobacteria bacterium]